MKNSIKIAVFTAARSEYGPLKPLLGLLQSDDYFDLRLLVGGAHFLSSQGNTINEIKHDGFPIHHEFDYLDHTGDQNTIAEANGRLQIMFGQYLTKNPCDVLLVIGDRTELLPAVSAALFAGIPIAHISGGEVTEGAIDDQIRNAVSKMSHIHFPATELYKQNLVRMGEEEWRICASGEPSLDGVLQITPLNKSEFYTKYGLNPDLPFVIATLHSETIGQKIDGQYIHQLTQHLIKNTTFQYLFTAANVDWGGKEINNALQACAKENDRIYFHQSLGKTNYYSALGLADLVFGNSSSGIIEAQSFGLPVVNIGSRQNGRTRNPNVIDTVSNIDKVMTAIEKALSADFKKTYENKPNVYGDGQSSQRIVEFIKTFPLDKALYKKSIY